MQSFNKKALGVYCCFFIAATITVLGCNLFPKKDKHPDVPYLSELLKDKTKFVKVLDTTNAYDFFFLNDDRMLVYSDDSTFKIIEVHGSDKNLIMERTTHCNSLFYIDTVGNIYCDNEKYIHPEYKEKQPFQLVVIEDSITVYRLSLQQLSPDRDSLNRILLEDYEKAILKRYGMKYCPSAFTGNCNDFVHKDNMLIVRGKGSHYNGFKKNINTNVKKFDESIITGYSNKLGGRLGFSTPDFLHYYILHDKYKFKGYYGASIIKLNSNEYIYTREDGLYLVK